MRDYQVFFGALGEFWWLKLSLACSNLYVVCFFDCVCITLDGKGRWKSGSKPCWMADVDVRQAMLCVVCWAALKAYKGFDGGVNEGLSRSEID